MRHMKLDERKDLLIKSAARLYSLGLDLEGAKEHIWKLIADDVGYDTPEMAQAVDEYTKLKNCGMSWS